MKQLLATTHKKIHIVFGLVNDKDPEVILPLLPKSASYYFCAPNISRALKVSSLKQKAEELNLTGTSHKSVKSAVRAALSEASPDDVIYVGGSSFVVAEVL